MGLAAGPYANSSWPFERMSTWPLDGHQQGSRGTEESCAVEVIGKIARAEMRCRILEPGRLFFEGGCIESRRVIDKRLDKGKGVG